MLSVGLVVDIVHRLVEAPRHIAEKPHLIGQGLAVLLELALLVHQLAEMHERTGRRE